MIDEVRMWLRSSAPFLIALLCLVWFAAGWYAGRL